MGEEFARVHSWVSLSCLEKQICTKEHDLDSLSKINKKLVNEVVLEQRRAGRRESFSPQWGREGGEHESRCSIYLSAQGEKNGPGLMGTIKGEAEGGRDAWKIPFYEAQTSRENCLRNYPGLGPPRPCNRKGLCGCECSYGNVQRAKPRKFLKQTRLGKIFIIQWGNKAVIKWKPRSLNVQVPVIMSLWRTRT